MLKLLKSFAIVFKSSSKSHEMPMAFSPLSLFSAAEGRHSWPHEEHPAQQCL